MPDDRLDDPVLPAPLQRQRRILLALNDAHELRARARLRLRVCFHPDPAAAEALAEWLD